MNRTGSGRLWLWAGATGVVTAALHFHFWELAAVPPGLDRDAAANGLLALKWLRGGLAPFWVPHASAPEPLMVWLQTLTTWLFGPSVLALRSVSALATVLGALAGFVLALEAGRGLDPAVRRWAAVLAGLGLAVSGAYSELGRTGLRATLFPAAGALFLTALLIGLRTGRRRSFVLAGLLLGGAAYTYLAARALPLAAGLFLALVFWQSPARRAQWRLAGLMVLVAGLVAAPQLAFFALHPEALLERARAVTAERNPLFAELGPWGVLGYKVWTAGQMFGWEWSGQYNQSGRPLLAPLLALGFPAGLAALWRWRHRPGLVALAVFIPVLLLPDFVAADRPRPHELRVIGVFVPAHVVAGLGLAVAARWLARRLPRRWAYAPAGLGAAVIVLWGLGDFRLAVAPQLRASAYAWYQRADVAKADFITTATGPVVMPLAEYTNWSTEYLAARRVTRVRGGLDEAGRLWPADLQTVRLLWPPEAARRTYEGVSYLFDPAALVLIHNGEAVLLPPAAQSFWSALPAAPAEALTTPTGELAARVYDLPWAVLGVGGAAAPMAQWAADQVFADSLRLVAVAADRAVLQPGDVLGVTAYWQAQRPAPGSYRYFVQVLDDSQNLRATEDVMPAYGALETDLWRPGERLPLRQLVRVPADLPPGRYWLSIGLYDPLTGERAPTVTAAGEPVDTVRLGPLKAPLPAQPPLAAARPVEAHFGGQLALEAYTLQRPDPTQVEVLAQLRALVRPAADYTLFVHVLDASGAIVAQTDVMPLGGAYPTSLWEAGERVITPLTVALPADLPPGPLTVAFGIYEWQTGVRLPVEAPPADLLVLTELTAAP